MGFFSVIWLVYDFYLIWQLENMFFVCLKMGNALQYLPFLELTNDDLIWSAWIHNEFEWRASLVEISLSPMPTREYHGCGGFYGFPHCNEHQSMKLLRKTHHLFFSPWGASSWTPTKLFPSVSPRSLKSESALFRLFPIHVHRHIYIYMYNIYIYNPIPSVHTFHIHFTPRSTRNHGVVFGRESPHSIGTIMDQWEYNVRWPGWRARPGSHRASSIWLNNMKSCKIWTHMAIQLICVPICRAANLPCTSIYTAITQKTTRFIRFHKVSIGLHP